MPNPAEANGPRGERAGWVVHLWVANLGVAKVAAELAQIGKKGAVGRKPHRHWRCRRILAANGVADQPQFFPFAVVQVAAARCAVQLFNKKIGLVRHQAGDAPGDGGIPPNHHKRAARNRDPGNGGSFPGDHGLVPFGRRAVGKVGVVGQYRFPPLGASAGNGPRVGPDVRPSHSQQLAGFGIKLHHL
ncbi:MAG: hypothetical protein UZ07_CHB004000400 [Chlorobi bacterium OLB7]|nr:MAG: hypothetical protein UZ07_CHB004000400 [Chlorobi bacterium OLB7]